MSSLANVNFSLIKAYERGGDAYLNHQSLDSNPYPVAATDLTKGGMAWEAGWKSQWYKAGAPPHAAPNNTKVTAAIANERDLYIDDMLFVNGISVKTVMGLRRAINARANTLK